MNVVRPRIKRSIASMIIASVFISTELVGSSRMQDRSVLLEGSRKGDTLALTTRETHAPLADPALVGARVSRR